MSHSQAKRTQRVTKTKKVNPSPSSNESKAANPFAQYFSHHARAFFLSMGQIYRQPLANFLTLLVIAIALVSLIVV